jgi:thioredoxin reductase
MPPWDVLIIGGGPAGLSCALMLGRCRHRVLVLDDGRPRNGSSRHAHGFLTRDGADPLEILALGREQLAPYDVTLRSLRATAVTPAAHGFDVTLEDGRVEATRKLVLATGLVDKVPEVPDFDELFGKGIWVCPYCDGWEVRDRSLGVYARGDEGAAFAVGMQAWSADVTLFTDGAGLAEECTASLADKGVIWRREKVVRFVGDDAQLRGVELAGGELVAVAALFSHLGTEQRSPFAAQLGCTLDEKTGGVKVSPGGQRSGVPHLWVIGDASENALLVVVAAAEGATAALSIHKALRSAHAL